MTYQQLTLNYTEAFASHTPNWASSCGLAYNPCDPCPPMGTCGGCCDTGAFTACNGGIWMNPCSPIVDAAAIPLPPPCPVAVCAEKKTCKKSKCGRKNQCSGPITVDYCNSPCATPLCITPCPQPVVPLVPLVQLDPCLNPWIKNLPWLQRTYAGRYDIIPRV